MAGSYIIGEVAPMARMYRRPKSAEPDLDIELQPLHPPAQPPVPRPQFPAPTQAPAFRQPAMSMSLFYIGLALAGIAGVLCAVLGLLGIAIAAPFAIAAFCLGIAGAVKWERPIAIWVIVAAVLAPPVGLAFNLVGVLAFICGPATTPARSASREESSFRPADRGTSITPTTIPPRSAASSAAQPVSMAPQVRVTNWTWRSQQYIEHSYEYLGQVQNVGSGEARFVRVQVAFYDAQRNIIETDDTYCDPSTLPPGGVGLFHGYATCTTPPATCDIRPLWQSPNEW